MKSAPLYPFGLRMGRGCSLQENKLAVTRKRGIGTAIHTPSFMLPWALQFSHQIRSSWRTRTRPAYPFTPSPSAGPNTQKFPDPSQLKTWLTSHCQSKITRKELPRPPLPEQETHPTPAPSQPPVCWNRCGCTVQCASLPNLCFSSSCTSPSRFPDEATHSHVQPCSLRTVGYS